MGKTVNKVEAEVVMDTLGDILAKKAIETLCDSRASQVNGRYY